MQNIKIFLLNLEYYITKKIVKDKNKSSFSKNAVAVAVLSVALGLCVMIIAVATVTGFQKEIANKVIGFGAHIQISNYDNNLSLETVPINKNQNFYSALENNPDIEHIQSFALKPGIIKTDEQIEGTVVKGIDCDFEWKFFEDRLIAGQKFTINKTDTVPNKNIVISATTAKLLKLKVGDKVQVWFIQNPPRVRLFEVGGIYETGLEEFDKMFILADIRHIQKLNNWSGDQISGIEIFIKDFNKLDAVNDFVSNEISYDLDAKTIKELYPSIFDWLGLLDMNAIVILVIMLLVASINMITTLLIIILERTNMIGILKAIGAKNISIRKIFLYYASFILVKGLFWGNLISITLCLIQLKFSIISLPQESYFVSTVPVNLNIIHLLLLNLGTIICCIAMLIVPSFIITRISPVSAIKYD